MYVCPFDSIYINSVQLFSHVQLFATPWDAACQASLSITNSRSMLKLMSIESLRPSNHLILYCPLLFLPSTFPSIREFGKLSSGHRTGKGQFIPIPKKVNAKECSNYCTIVLISHAREVMLKILQARLQLYVNRELPHVQAGKGRKGRGTRDIIANICWIIEKARECQKNIYFCFIDYAKAFDCGSQ